MKQNKVYVPLTGGLGNQLFQYSAALSLDPEEIVFITNIGNPRVNNKGIPEILSFELGSRFSTISLGFTKVDTKFLSKVFGYCIRSSAEPTRLESKNWHRFLLRVLVNVLFSIYLRKKISINIGTGVGNSVLRTSNNFIIGYFQTYLTSNSKTAMHTLNQIRFPGENPSLDNLRNLASSDLPLIVHVRLGDYRNEENFGLLSEKYYEEAIGQMFQTGKFNKIWLYSDEPQSAINIIPNKFQKYIRIIGEIEGSASATLESMRLGKGYVIANSTYSWWAARLSLESSAEVIFPQPWFRNMSSPTELCPPNWMPVLNNHQ